MAGANMFVIYASGNNNNITLSPRSGRGEFRPNVNPTARVTLLEGTGISSDGVMTANIRCDSCLTWDGGSMSPTSGNSNWIWSVKQGSALNSADVSANIQKHDAYGTFTFDLPAGTSGDTANPFVKAASVTQSAGASQPSSSGGNGGSSDASSSGSSEAPSGSGSESESSDNGIRKAHGIIMAVVFLLLFPTGALMMYLSFSRKVFVHAPIQLLSVCLLIAGMALGITLGLRIGNYDGYHQIIGYITVSCLLLFQPAFGLIQHLRHRKLGKRTIFGHIHGWLGRSLIFLGIINGGLGLYVAGGIGSREAPTWSVIVYSIVATVVVLIYIAFASGAAIFRKRKSGSSEELKHRNANGNTNGQKHDY